MEADSDDRVTVLNALRRIVRVLRTSSRRAEQVGGVSGAQTFVLHSLRDAGPMTINALARATMTHQSSVSVVVQRLVERGLVKRVVSTADRRRREVTLTAAGVKLLRRAPDVAQTRLVEGVERLPVRRRRELATGLTALVEAMGADAEPADMFFEDGESMGTNGARRRAAAPAARRRRPTAT